MVKRSDRARFMPGAHVFPGGMVEDCDLEAERWGAILGQHCEETGLRVGAIREVFEETGLLLSRPALDDVRDPGAREHVRRLLAERRVTVRKDAREFSALFDHFRVGGGADAAGAPALAAIAPDVSALLNWSHWTTPRQERYRYATHFFVARVPAPDSNVVHDRSETTAVDWFSPDEAIRRHHDGSITLPPPTYITLAEFVAKFPTLDSVMDAARAGRPMTTVQPDLNISPDGLVIRMPGDADHPDTPPDQRNTKNRVVVNGRDYQWESGPTSKL